MQTVANHSRKINKALTLASIGQHPASASAMLDAVPAPIVAALTARQLAETLDANWRLAQASKAIAIKDALDEGGVYDAKAGAFRAIRPAPQTVAA